MVTKTAFERTVTDLVSTLDVALQDTTPDQLVAAHNSLVPVEKRKKKFASKEKGLDAVWAILDSYPIHVKAQKILDVAEQIGFKFKAEKLTQAKSEIEEYTRNAPVPASTPVASTPAPKKGTAAKAAVTKAAPAAPAAGAKITAAGRTPALLEAFRKSKDHSAHVDELAKLMGTTVLTVRNTIDAARRGNHAITSMGKGVFKFSDPEAAKPAAKKATGKKAAATAEPVGVEVVPPQPVEAASETPAAVAEQVAEATAQEAVEGEPVPEPLTETLNISGEDAENREPSDEVAAELDAETVGEEVTPAAEEEKVSEAA